MRYVPSAKERALYPPVAGVMTLPDERELCVTDEAYRLRTTEMADRQGNICAICRHLMTFPTFDHELSRGLGGHRRNDAITYPSGRWRNAALCLECNTRKGSTRYAWIDRQYVPVLQGWPS